MGSRNVHVPPWWRRRRLRANFTRGFRRPYDLRIHHAMVAAASDLLTRFGAVTAYTESDEISLIFPPRTSETIFLPFAGRVQKICSVTAGFASARFNAHMAEQPFDESRADEAALAARVRQSEAHFDARVFAVPDEGAPPLTAMAWWPCDPATSSATHLRRPPLPASSLVGSTSACSLAVPGAQTITGSPATHNDVCTGHPLTTACQASSSSTCNGEH